MRRGFFRGVAAAAVAAALIVALPVVGVHSDVTAEANSGTALVGTAVGEPVSFTLPIPAARSVVVDLQFKLDGKQLTPGAVSLSTEREPGSGNLEPVGLGVVGKRLVGAIGQGSEFRPPSGDLRLRAIFRTTGLFTVDITVWARGAKPDRIRMSQEIQVASRFTQIGLVRDNTEIIDVTPDGRTVVSTSGQVTDISDPRNPVVLGDIGDTAASVAVTKDGKYALFAGGDPFLRVADLATASEVAQVPVPPGGDSVAVSADGRFAAVAIEAESTGLGGVAIVDLIGPPSSWTSRTVPFDPSDPAFGDTEDNGLQTEYVAFGPRNKIAAAFQANNAVAVVDAATATVEEAFSLGTLPDASGDPATLDPDGIAWTPDGLIATANEGGTRSWSLFTPAGERVFDSGAELLGKLALKGKSPDDPQFEDVKAATFSGGETFAFVGSERTQSLSVYRIDGRRPVFSQVVALEFAIRSDGRPEGVRPVPSRNLVLVANEDDDTISILERQTEFPSPEPTTAEPRLDSGVVPWSGPDDLTQLADGRYLIPSADDHDQTGAPGQVYLAQREGSRVFIDRLLEIRGSDYETDPGNFADTGIAGIVADPTTGGWWAAAFDPNSNAGPRLLHVARDGRVTEQYLLGERFDPEPRGLLRIPDGTGLVVLTPDDIIRFDLATHEIDRFPLQLQAARDPEAIARLANGDLLISTGDSDTAVFYRTTLAGATPGRPLVAVFVRDYSVPQEVRSDRYFHRGVTLLPDGDVVTLMDAGVGSARLSHVEDVDVGGPAAAVSFAANLSGAGPAGRPFTVSVATDRPGGFQVQAKPSAAPADAWAPVLGDTPPPVRAPGTVNATVRAPLVDGTYDLRILYISSAGTRTLSDLAAGALVVDTPAGAADLLDPTTAAPRQAIARKPFAFRFDTTQPGTYELLAKPAGSPDGDYRPLATTGAPEALAAGTVDATAVSPTTAGTYDLRLVLAAGGDQPVSSDEPGALVVTDPPPASIAFENASTEAPLRAGAGDSVTVRFSSDQAGRYSVQYKPAGAGDEDYVALTFNPLSELSSPGSVGVAFDAPVVDGAYDFRLRFTNRADRVSQVLEPRALVVSTPDPTPAITAPTASAPATVVGTFGSTIALVGSFPSAGENLFEYRPAGAGDDGWTTTRWDSNFRNVSGPGSIATSFSTAFLPEGAYDLRLRFRNRLGDEGSTVELRAFVVEMPAPRLALSVPEAAPPAIRLPGGSLDVAVQGSQPGRISLLAKPEGADPAAFVELAQFDLEAESGTFTVQVPAVTGSYDLRAVLTDLSGITKAADGRAALRVVEELPAQTIVHPRPVEPAKRGPGGQFLLRAQSLAAEPFVIEARPSGSADAWAQIGTGAAISPAGVLRNYTVTAPSAPGTYDLRTVTVLGIETHVDVAPASLVVGRGPESPVVIQEVATRGPAGTGDDFLELRNVSGTPYDLSGAYVVTCANAFRLFWVDEGVVLQPGQRFLAAASGYPGEAGSATSPLEDATFRQAIADTTGVRLFTADGVLLDSVGFGSLTQSGLCQEGNAAAPAASAATASQSANRDTVGADTDANGADFTRMPRSPQGLAATG